MSDSRTISFSGSAVQYKTSGCGPCLLLIHGFGEDGSVWDSWIPSLSQTHKIIVPDLPGSGLSEDLSILHAGLDDFAELIQEILDSEGINRCILSGHSMGGYIALGFAEKYPERLHGLGLVHSTCFADNETKVLTRKKSMEFISKYGSRDYFKTSIPGLFNTPELHRAETGRLLEKAAGMSPETLILHQNAMIQRPDRSGLVQMSGIPVFFQMGVHDQSVPLESSLRQCHLPGVSEVSILRNSAHMGMLEEPDRSLQGIRHFLTNL